MMLKGERAMLLLVGILTPLLSLGQARNNSKNQIDENGYVFFCLCMGRFGNQADNFLGGLNFAKKLNRTLVLPGFLTYSALGVTKTVAHNKWFNVDAIQPYHRVITGRDFMKHISPKVWPPGRRTGFCWLPENTKETKCAMKDGDPFRSFWDSYDVDFDDYSIYHIDYQDDSLDQWRKLYPPEKYPVLAFKGAPASFPVSRENRDLQRYLVWSDRVIEQVNVRINTLFNGNKFIGIHLRNGDDWTQACDNVEGLDSYMASPQCLEDTGKKVTKKICFPPKKDILRLLTKVVLRTKIKNIFVATDKDPMIKEIESHLKSYKVKVTHLDPDPHIDLAILGQSEVFIGNCVSSFTSFVTRERAVHGKETLFWGFSE